MEESQSISIDTSGLESVSNGNIQFQTKMMRYYVEDFATYLAELRIAWEGLNVKDIQRIAHKMKSPAGIIKVRKIDSLLCQLEEIQPNTLENRDIKASPFNQLNETFESVKRTLNERIDSISKDEE